MNFYSSTIDPCLFTKDKEDGTKSFLILYVDDGGIFGTDEDINETIESLQNFSM
jgi:hypothetical protein